MIIATGVYLASGGPLPTWQRPARAKLVIYILLSRSFGFESVGVAYLDHTLYRRPNGTGSW